MQKTGKGIRRNDVMASLTSQALVKRISSIMTLLPSLSSYDFTELLRTVLCKTTAGNTTGMTLPNNCVQYCVKLQKMVLLLRPYRTIAYSTV